MVKDKQNICVDFDGVLNNYTGWKGTDELYEPRCGAVEFLERLSKMYNVIIFTTRPKEKVIDWLEEYECSHYIVEVTNIKVGAYCYIDDRGLKFNGDYEQTLNELDDFKAHWE